MKKMKRVPIAVARRVAAETGATQVVLILRCSEQLEPGVGHDVTHVVTYGKSLQDCALAAEAGNNVKRWMGWPDEMCHDVPARVRRMQKRKRKVRAP